MLRALASWLAPSVTGSPQRSTRRAIIDLVCDQVVLVVAMVFTASS
jgi:hypothetical protein